MSYNIEEVGALDSCCLSCENSKLGTKLDTLIEDLSNDEGYSGDLLSDAEKKYLNNMCVGTAGLGDILDDVLTSSQAYEPVTSTVSDALKTSLEGVCETFRISQIGSRLQDAILKINSMQEFDESYIKSLYFTGFEDYPAVIDDEAETIVVDLPYNAVASALVVNFTASAGSSVLNGETILESSVSEIDFTNPVTLSCISKDESVSLDYVTTVNVIPNDEAELLSLSIDGIDGVIDEVNKTVTVELNFGADLTSQIATFTMSDNATAYSGESEVVSGITVLDFSLPFALDIVSEDEETTNTYTINVSVLKNTEAEFLTFGTPAIAGIIDDVNKEVEISVPFGSDLSLITLSFTVSDNAKVYNDSDVEVTSPIEGFIYTVPFEMSVVSEDEETTNVYTIEFLELPNTDSTLQSFTLAGVSATIDNDLKTISVETPAATDLSSLAATFVAPLQATVYVVSGETEVEQVSAETLNNFTSPLTYRVISGAGGEYYTDYTVTATVAGG